jgi:hypothetical protein
MSDTNHLHELTTCGFPLVEKQAKSALALCEQKQKGELSVESFRSQMEALVTDAVLASLDSNPQAKSWIVGAVGLNIILNS